jgi:hypothetical protein
MNPLLADTPAAQSPEQSGNGASAAASTASSAPATGGELPKLAPADRRACASCGATLAPGQSWCLQCGAGAPGSLAAERGWRPLAGIAAFALVLLAGAGTAAYAALTQSPAKPPLHVLIAQVSPTTTVAPGGSTLNTPVTPTTPGAKIPAPGTPVTPGSTSRLGLPSSTIKPPKLPTTVPLPRSSSTTHVPVLPLPTPAPTHTTPTTTTPSAGEGTTPTGTTTAPQTPNPILLDTNAASDYNPSGYPSSYFGDPRLAIDGETSTAWTLQVEPKVAPRMAAGLALDFKTATRLGTLEVVSTTPGATVEVFGANGHTLPAQITDPAWTALSGAHVLKKKISTVNLHTGGKAFRFLVLWFIKAPASAVGTPEAPGHVSVGEVVPYSPVAK